MDKALEVLKDVWFEVLKFARTPLAGYIQFALFAVLVYLLVDLYKTIRHFQNKYDLTFSFALFLTWYEWEFTVVRGLSAPIKKDPNELPLAPVFYILKNEEGEFDGTLYWGIPKEGQEFLVLENGADATTPITKKFWDKAFKLFHPEDMKDFQMRVRQETEEIMKEKAIK